MPSYERTSRRSSASIPRFMRTCTWTEGQRFSAGALAGVTLAVKDNLPVAGMPWTDGSAVWRDRVPDEDTVPVARARTAGAAVLGKTNLPELAAAVGTTNAIFPATNNPWRAGITPGGSSGGSAAAVGAGMATVAMGTDMGGSIRIPASCCGVVGLRPSPDRVPSEIVDPAGLSVVAPLGRTVRDVKLLYSVMARTLEPDLPPTSKPLQIGVAGTTALGMDPACADACRRAADALDSAGHRVQRIAWESEAVAAGYGVVRRASMASFPADPQLFAPGIRKLVEQGRALSALDYFQAFESATAAAYAVVVRPLLTDFDFLLTPTLGLVPMPIEAVPPFLSEPYGRYIQFVLPVSFAHTPRRLDPGRPARRAAGGSAARRGVRKGMAAAGACGRARGDARLRLPATTRVRLTMCR